MSGQDSSGPRRPPPASERWQVAERRAPRWPRWVRNLVGTVVVLAILVAVLAVPLVVLPDTAGVADADSDAVVVLAGGSGERFPAAEAAAAFTGVELLVVSEGDHGDDSDVLARCGTEGEPRIECFEAAPLTTRGEARAVAALAADHGWDQLTVVTSTYHVTRARTLFDRCVDAEIEMVRAQPDLSPDEWAWVAVREMAGLARDAVLQRGC